MTDIPETRYARNGDVHLAYQAFGDGPDLLVCMGVPISMDAWWDAPQPSRFLRRLASFSRVLIFDRRGRGLSDPISPPTPTTLEQHVEDALAVLNDAGSQRAAVLGSDIIGGQTCLLLAASHPSRVSAAIVVNTAARRAPSADYAPADQQMAVPRHVATTAGWLASDGVEYLTPSHIEDEAFRSWWRRSVQRSSSPGTNQAMRHVMDKLDIRSVLQTIRVPTLVLHRSGNRMTSVEHGRYLGSHIPDAKYVELEGNDQIMFAGPQDDILDEVEEFVTGSRHGPPIDRVLATVLFTDVVASTEQAARLGDRTWRDVLDQHDAMAKRQLERHRGRFLKATGDGILASFDGPARAILCACAIRDGVRQLGLEIRAGLHVGEVELRDDDVTGIAVNIARRVCDLGEASEILVSRTVTDLVAGSGLEFDDRGEHELKGVPGRWQLYGVRT
jgi:class 3 adenylate cyclase